MKDANIRRFGFSSAGDFLAEWELLDRGGRAEKSLSFFHTTGDVKFTNLHKLVGSVRRRNATTVPSKTQMKQH